MPGAAPDRSLTVPAAILGAGLAIALSLAFTFRYSVEPVPPRPAAIRFDRWTGEVRFCSAIDDDLSLVLNCGK